VRYLRGETPMNLLKSLHPDLRRGDSHACYRRHRERDQERRDHEQPCGNYSRVMMIAEAIAVMTMRGDRGRHDNIATMTASAIIIAGRSASYTPSSLPTPTKQLNNKTINENNTICKPPRADYAPPPPLLRRRPTIMRRAIRSALHQLSRAKRVYRD